MPPIAAIRTIAGPAVLTWSGTTLIRGSHSTGVLPLSPQLVNRVRYRRPGRTRTISQEPGKQPAVSPQLAQELVRLRLAPAAEHHQVPGVKFRLEPGYLG